MNPVQHAQLHRFIGTHIADKERASRLPVRATDWKVILHHPLPESFAFNSSGIGSSEQLACKVQRSGAASGRNAVDHGRRKRDLFGNS